MKDAKGHGSEARGGATISHLSPASLHNKVALDTARKNLSDYKAPGEAISSTEDQALSRHILGGVSPADAAERVQAGDHAASGGQPVASNAHAAATLASGAKSAPVETHPAMNKSWSIMDFKHMTDDDDRKSK